MEGIDDESAPGLSTLSLRQLEYVVAVSKELSFARASDRLHVARSVLSDQVRRLERQLDVRLFERSSREVRPTAAGLRYAEAAGTILLHLDGAGDLARRAAHDHPVLNVGFVASPTDVLAPRIVTEFVRRRPEARIRFQQVGYDDLVRAGLDDGHVDVAFHTLLATNPMRPSTSLVLATRPARVLVPDDHPFADRASIHFADLDLHRLIVPKSTALHTALHTAGSTRSRGPIAHSPEELIDYVALGHFGLMAACEAEHYHRPGVTVLPVEAAPEFAKLLSWRDNGRPVVTEFVEAAHAVLEHGSAEPA